MALAPLTPVIASDTRDGAADAMVEARTQWSDPGTREAAHLTWVPIDQAHDVAEEDIHALIAQMNIVNDERAYLTPGTPAYRDAELELGRLASLVCEATSAEEHLAVDEALRQQRSLGGREGSA